MTRPTLVQRRASAGAPELDLLRPAVVQVPCVACGRYYGVTLRQVLLAQQLVHQGCPARHEPECPPVAYRKLADEEALHEFDESWRRLVDKVRSAGIFTRAAGERLELNRVLRPTTMTRAAFAGAIAVILIGVGIGMRHPDVGIRAVGAGLIALTLWLVRYDVARHTVRQPGLTRYIVVGLLAGYVWLGCAGILAVATGVPPTSLMYDATLHVVFLGFVMSMVSAHAPVIVPAVLGRSLAFDRRFYAHLAVLHASVLVRVVGDLVESLGRWRYWGGMLNAVALLMCVLNVGRSLMASPPHVSPR